MEEIQNLKERYSEHGICLGIGAGVSHDSGIPMWDDLLKMISFEIFNSDDIYSYFKNSGYSYEAFASFLKNRAGERFTGILRDCLYKNFEFYNNNINKYNNRDYVRLIDSKNTTLKAVGSFCAKKIDPPKRKFSSNPQLHGIVNFNIDALLEAYPTAKYAKRILRTVERPSAGRLPGKINVYHIHGFLRFDSKKDPEHESSDKIVLAEDEYYDLFNNPSDVFNYTILYLLREYSFLFIGLSMQDINLRRHLHLSKKEIIEGYKEEKISKAKLRRKIIDKVNKHFAILKDTGHQISNEYHQQTLMNLGVNVIWVKDYIEIQDILREIYSIPGYDWNDVF